MKEVLCYLEPTCEFFCMNPYQLKQEIERLNAWIEHQCIYTGVGLSLRDVAASFGLPALEIPKVLFVLTPIKVRCNWIHTNEGDKKVLLIDAKCEMY